MIITGRTHLIKTTPSFFDRVWHGFKTGELRKNDRNYQVGDRVMLLEYSAVDEEYLGRAVLANVTDVVTFGQYPDGLQEGYCMLSIDNVAYFENLDPTTIAVLVDGEA